MFLTFVLVFERLLLYVYFEIFSFLKLKYSLLFFLLLYICWSRCQFACEGSNSKIMCQNNTHLSVCVYVCEVDHANVYDQTCLCFLWFARTLRVLFVRKRVLWDMHIMSRIDRLTHSRLVKANKSLMWQWFASYSYLLISNNVAVVNIFVGVCLCMCVCVCVCVCEVCNLFVESCEWARATFSLSFARLALFFYFVVVFDCWCF